MNRLARVHKRESQSDFDLEPIEATPAGHVKTGHLEGAAGEPGFGGEGDMGKGGGNPLLGTRIHGDIGNSHSQCHHPARGLVGTGAQSV